MNYDLLYTMLNTESVSGGEIPLQKKVAAYMPPQQWAKKPQCAAHTLPRHASSQRLP